ncbi:hypothetical protein HOP50_02g17680 [Chloropicon primus]|uniref:Uncharacterized protein n=1 Tax=Chloropicon primus TaxID=1764295 RepID=A0A5B8MFI8_9CHLO|nr:hypothetical protein A3770_02p17710 [Chloropicon primus]UPQ98462.1 hypothetical protein HOP50_02g17680 [Chloropicon primus]|eukprot:QDZ19253.1 hypothetical protein A3770_02p17710 [Chloropicon primus]
MQLGQDGLGLGLDTPTGGRVVRREIEDVALSRKPSPLKKKQVLDLWEKYRNKLWDDTCENSNVDPSSSIAAANIEHASEPARNADPFAALAHLRNEERQTSTQEFLSGSSSLPSVRNTSAVAPSSGGGSTSTNLPELLPMETVLRVRQTLCQINNNDIANMKPGYFQELVTLGHLIIRRSQEYYT